jgi:hypothetical protein
LAFLNYILHVVFNAFYFSFIDLVNKKKIVFPMASGTIFTQIEVTGMLLETVGCCVYFLARFG